MFRQPLLQILNIWSSQAPQALNIIQVAKSTFPVLVGLPGQIWTRRHTFLSPPQQAALWTQPFLWREGWGSRWTSALLGASGKASGKPRAQGSRGRPGGGFACGSRPPPRAPNQVICRLPVRTLPVFRPETALSGGASYLGLPQALSSFRSHSHPRAGPALSPLRR